MRGARRGVRALVDPYGSFLPSLIYHDARDRLSGRRASANARWGLISRPLQGDKLIWICAGASRNSVRLGVELARAIAATRRDVALTLTFEAEYPDLLAPLEPSARVSSDYAPADHVASLNVLWRRLTPFALIIAGHAPRDNLLAVAAMARHALLVAPPVAVPGRFERTYPTHAAPSPGPSSAPAADLDTLLAHVGMDPALDSVLGDGTRPRLWWWHGVDARAALQVVALFRGHLPGEHIVLSGPVCAALAHARGRTQCLSRLDGAPIDCDTLVLADEARWFPALAACAAAAHFATREPDALWQALAGGARVSVGPDVSLASAQLSSSVARFEDVNDVVHEWASLRADPVKTGVAQEASRRAFAAERRLAQNAIADLMDRVLGWQ
jgi:hypothetical protein